MSSKLDIKSKYFWTEGWGSVSLAVLAAFFIRWIAFEAFVIPSGSMFPTLMIRDHIFVNKFVYGIRVPFTEKWMVKFNEVKRGEVVVFKYPRDKSIFYIKRIVGLPGDKIFYENGTLYINDIAQEKLPPNPDSQWDVKWLRDKDFQRDGNTIDQLDRYSLFTESLGESNHSILVRKGEYLDRFEPVIVPAGHFFAMGDNRNNSADSRYWGFMPEENLLGRASIIWLSCEETLPVLSFLCNPLTIRVGRFFHGVN